MAERNMDDILKNKILSDIGGSKASTEKTITPIETAKKTHGGRNIGSEVFKPIFNKAVSDLVVNGLALVSDLIIGAIDVKLYGENRHKRVGRSGYTNYNSVSRLVDTFNNRRYTSVAETTSSKRTYGFNLREIVLSDRGAVDRVIDKIDEIIAMYGSATVGDLYQLVDLPTESIDFKYGWTSANGFSARRVFEGHLLVVPEPKTL